MVGHELIGLQVVNGPGCESIGLAWRQERPGDALGRMDRTVAAQAAIDVVRIPQVGVGLLCQAGGDGVGDAHGLVVGGVRDDDGPIDAVVRHHRAEEARERLATGVEATGEAVVGECGLQQGQAGRLGRQIAAANAAAVTTLAPKLWPHRWMRSSGRSPRIWSSKWPRPAPTVPARAFIW